MYTHTHTGYVQNGALAYYYYYIRFELVSKTEGIIPQYTFKLVFN